MVEIRTENLTKRFGKVIALDKVTLKIRHGELFTLLGPSGCGKTTFLRTIAGFEMPDEGRIFFDGVDVTDVPAHKRGAGMVFQNYALWPHMSVYDNIAYGLKLRKLPKEEIDKRVKEALRLVKLEGLEKRNPHQLSGGQQQRVAVARVLVINPRVLLLDEPLSNLDAKLRIEMRGEVKKLQRRLGITTIYVTHDQEEAMSISDRIAIMNNGRIEQIGTPMEIYFRPKNDFVADFIGQGTFMRGEVIEIGRWLKVELENGKIIHAIPSDPTNPPKIGDKVLITIRPESFKIGRIEGFNVFKCKIDTVFFLGKFKRLRAESENYSFLIEVDPTMRVEAGDEITVSVSPDKTLAIKSSKS
ncbi:ABC transporter ATP-binding protein [Candidatus Geothermarchaeota archaeon]|nr:MAG: ABC transporter ATP-binding protein [Candidatus Geothermarchaeota archaeon]